MGRGPFFGNSRKMRGFPMNLSPGSIPGLDDGHPGFPFFASDGKFDFSAYGGPPPPHFHPHEGSPFFNPHQPPNGPFSSKFFRFLTRDFPEKVTLASRLVEICASERGVKVGSIQFSTRFFDCFSFL